MYLNLLQFRNCKETCLGISNLLMIANNPVFLDFLYCLLCNKIALQKLNVPTGDATAHVLLELQFIRTACILVYLFSNSRKTQFVNVGVNYP